VSLATQSLPARARRREELLRPWPRITPARVAALVVIAAAYAWGLAGTHASPGELARGIPNMADFVRRLNPPQWQTQPLSVPLPGPSALVVPVPEILFAIFETLQMALIGTTAAVFLALPCALLAARNTSPHPLVYQVTRLLLNAKRAIPDIIFALIFVAAVGLGPFSGVLALMVGSFGSMAKVYAEAIEAIDPQQVLAIRATGADRAQTFVFGVVPQALPLMASYTLLFFEQNVRSATILGIVGAGGVGFVLSKYMALFQYQRLMGALILIVVAVTLIDRFSDALRKRII
jgi:phosphonate transport system permease protein